MYVRVARFENVDPSRVDEQIAELRQQIDAGRRGEVPAEFAEQTRVLMDTITRFVQLVDRANGTFLALAFVETEEDLRRVDEALNAMSPGEGGGRRTSVELYEVAIDEAFG
jgi:hypothetical protein